MITKITKKHLIALSFIICHLAYSSIMTSCSDDFLAEKRPYGQFGENDIYSSWESVKLRLNFIYECNLPAFRDYNKNGGNQGGNHSSNGPADHSGLWECLIFYQPTQRSLLVTVVAAMDTIASLLWINGRIPIFISFSGQESMRVLGKKCASVPML